MMLLVRDKKDVFIIHLTILVVQRTSVYRLAEFRKRVQHKNYISGIKHLIWTAFEYFERN